MASSDAIIRGVMLSTRMTWHSGEDDEKAAINDAAVDDAVMGFLCEEACWNCEGGRMKVGGRPNVATSSAVCDAADRVRAEAGELSNVEFDDVNGSDPINGSADDEAKTRACRKSLRNTFGTGEGVHVAERPSRHNVESNWCLCM